MSQQIQENLALVDTQDHQIGVMEKYQTHQNPPQLHRASSVWLFNDKGETLFQKRSIKKIVGANLWANTVCGNVYDGESYKDCALRRLKIELNITDVKIEPIYTFSYKAFCNEKYSEHEIDRVFIGKYKGEVKPTPEEASEVNWFNWNELLNKVRQVDMPDPQDSLEMSLGELTVKTKPQILEFAGQQIEIVPWTIMMLQDDKLVQAIKDFA